jgi:hypothetical protein
VDQSPHCRLVNTVFVSVDIFKTYVLLQNVRLGDRTVGCPVIANISPLIPKTSLGSIRLLPVDIRTIWNYVFAVLKISATAAYLTACYYRSAYCSNTETRVRSVHVRTAATKLPTTGSRLLFAPITVTRLSHPDCANRSRVARFIVGRPRAPQENDITTNLGSSDRTSVLRTACVQRTQSICANTCAVLCKEPQGLWREDRT